MHHKLPLAHNAPMLVNPAKELRLRMNTATGEE